jgi:manganese efflux pump family protein
MFEKLKIKWKISSNLQLVKVFIVFSITGSFALVISSPIIENLGINPQNLDWYIYWPVRIILITLVYQVALLIVAAVFFELKFFWEFEKRFLKRIGFKNLK